MALDYWLNKLMFDLQGDDGRDLWTNHREEVIAKYPVSLEIKQALLKDDFAFLYHKTNPYLMRFFLLICGHGDAESIKILSAIDPQEKLNNG